MVILQITPLSSPNQSSNMLHIFIDLYKRYIYTVLIHFFILPTGSKYAQFCTLLSLHKRVSVCVFE